MSNKDQVQKFYEVLWDGHNHSAIPSVLHEDFTFRGSLGQETKGHDGFAEYVDMVHRALGDYRCIIDQLVSEGDKVFAKMIFTGVHRDEFMGFPPSGKHVEWRGRPNSRVTGRHLSQSKASRTFIYQARTAHTN